MISNTLEFGLYLEMTSTHQQISNFTSSKVLGIFARIVDESCGHCREKNGLYGNPLGLFYEEDESREGEEMIQRIRDIENLIDAWTLWRVVIPVIGRICGGL